MGGKGLTEWKSETENWKTEFSIGLKYLQTCVFNGLNLESTNIGLSSFYEGKNI